MASLKEKKKSVGVAFFYASSFFGSQSVVKRSKNTITLGMLAFKKNK